MGRKPDRVIALHFVRGEKSGQNTNRYSQTCSHCNTVFPTGRQETLRAHLGRCPVMTQDERNEAISQMYQYPFQATRGNLSGENNNEDGEQQENFPVTAVGTTFEEFSGLNVLAGAAQDLDANNLMIDPSLTGPSSTNAEMPPMVDTVSTYEHNNINHYPTTTADSSWAFPSLSAFQGPMTAFNQVSSTVPNYLPFNPAPTSLPPWTFATVTTVPPSFVAHPNPSAFSSSNISNATGFVHESGRASVPPEQDSQNVQPRKLKEPYDESKKERVSNMRKIGACIRCSRLRKNCDPTRPCSQCTKTKTAKTWVGPCTSLNKGQEFSFWYDTPLEQIKDSHLAVYAANSIPERYTGHLEVAFFGDNGPKLCFDVLRCQTPNTDANGFVANNLLGEASVVCYIIDESKDLAQKLLEHAHINQHIILDAINIPAIDATVHTAAVLSSSQDDSQEILLYGSAMRRDTNLARILELWLAVALLTTEELNPAMRLIDDAGNELNSPALGLFLTIIRSQLDAILDSVILESKKDNVLHKLDANILSQSYKHLFNLVIAIFLALNTIENYCAFIERHAPNLDTTEMVEQAESLADKYTYCVQNIKMIPKLVLGQDGCLLGMEAESGDRANFDVQRSWIAESVFSEDELEAYHTGTALGGGRWTGRLWARILLAMRAT